MISQSDCYQPNLITRNIKILMKRVARITLPLTLLILTIAGVEWFVGWANIINGFIHLSAKSFWSAMGLMVFSYVLRTWRIQVSLAMHQHFPELFKLSLTHNILNIMMPMRTGEASFPILMKSQFQIPMLTASLHLIMFRLLDLLCLLSIGGVLLLWHHSPVFSFLIASLFVAVIAFTEKLKHLTLLILQRLHHPLANKICATLSQLPTSGRRYFNIAMLTLISWMSKLSAFVLIVIGISELSFQTALLGIVGADLSSVLPIHGVAGSGTFEGAFVLAAEITGLGNLSSSFPALLEASVQLHVFLLGSAAAIYTFSIMLAAVAAVQRNRNIRRKLPR